MGLIFKISEAPESQLKEFLGLVRPKTDCINIVGLPGGHLNTYYALGMCFGGITAWSTGPEAFSGLIFKVSEAPKSQLKVFLGFIWPTIDRINIVG